MKLYYIRAQHALGGYLITATNILEACSLFFEEVGEHSGGTPMTDDRYISVEEYSLRETVGFNDCPSGLDDVKTVALWRRLIEQNKQGKKT